MTTRRHEVRRERAQDWPILAGHEIQEDVEVLSVETSRHWHEELETAVAQASAMLGSALSQSTFVDKYKLWLIAWGRTVLPTSRVSAYHAERDRLWTTIEASGTPVPEGSRTEIKMRFDDGAFCYCGSVNFEIRDLPTAVELTRRENAVCLATETLSVDPVRNLESSSPFVPSDVRRSLFVRAASGELGDWIFLARGFGLFDDAMVGVDVLSKGDFLDTVERALAIGEGQ